MARSTRWAEIQADQMEAKAAIDAALGALRAKGYDHTFCRDLLEGTIHYSRACSRDRWPGTTS